MFLYEQLAPERVLIAPDVSGRDELFENFGKLFERLRLVGSGDTVTRLLKEREAILSTGIGEGWAIPHAQIAGVGRVVTAVSVHPDAIDYPALDNEPVRLVFCLIGDANTTADHLAGLARLARLARQADALARLVRAATPQDFIDTLKSIEKA